MKSIIKLELEVNSMTFYEIETKNRKAITYFEVYYYREDISNKYKNLIYKFNIHFLSAYEVAQSYGDLKDKFAKELQLLQDDFYNYMYNAGFTNTIKMRLEKDDYKREEEEKKKIYDWFLPKQKAFADKWGLGINVD